MGNPPIFQPLVRFSLTPLLRSGLNTEGEIFLRRVLQSLRLAPFKSLFAPLAVPFFIAFSLGDFDPNMRESPLLGPQASCGSFSMRPSFFVAPFFPLLNWPAAGSLFFKVRERISLAPQVLRDCFPHKDDSLLRTSGFGHFFPLCRSLRLIRPVYSAFRDGGESSLPALLRFLFPRSI